LRGQASPRLGGLSRDQLACHLPPSLLEAAVAGHLGAQDLEDAMVVQAMASSLAEPQPQPQPPPEPDAEDEGCGLTEMARSLPAEDGMQHVEHWQMARRRSLNLDRSEPAADALLPPPLASQVGFEVV